jgi:hypothetical protein
MSGDATGREKAVEAARLVKIWVEVVGYGADISVESGGLIISLVITCRATL